MYLGESGVRDLFVKSYAARRLGEKAKEALTVSIVDSGITQQMHQHRFFPCNKTGRDFVIGDLHGDFPKLEAALRQKSFDPARDRLFALGDMVDRGSASARLVGLLREPWFFSVIGNHELMLLEGIQDPGSAKLHCLNGGHWFYRLSVAEQRSLGAILLENLALAFTIETQRGMVGAIHATAPLDWRNLQEIRFEVSRWHDLVWDREDYNAACRDPESLPPVSGIDAVLHGHVSCAAPWRAANRLWIDTLYRGGSPTIVSLDELPQLLGESR